MEKCAMEDCNENGDMIEIPASETKCGKMVRTYACNKHRDIIIELSKKITGVPPEEVVAGYA